MKSIITAVFLFMHISGMGGVKLDLLDDIALHFKNANSKEIAKNFAPFIELIIIDQEDVYSKAQSEQILKDFFLKNPPSKITIKHRLNNNANFKYGEFILQAKQNTYRVAITFTKQLSSNQFLISELRIEKE